MCYCAGKPRKERKNKSKKMSFPSFAREINSLKMFLDISDLIANEVSCSVNEGDKFRRLERE